MSGALDKEKIYDVLRVYHTHQFPVKIKDPVVDNLRNEFTQMEDQIISMILSLANGKAEFIDPSKELGNFQNKLQRNLPSDSDQDANRNLFTNKINELNNLLTMAKDAGFRLRPVRGAVKVAA